MVRALRDNAVRVRVDVREKRLSIILLLLFLLVRVGFLRGFLRLFFAVVAFVFWSQIVTAPGSLPPGLALCHPASSDAAPPRCFWQRCSLSLSLWPSRPPHVCCALREVSASSWFASSFALSSTLPLRPNVIAM